MREQLKRRREQLNLTQQKVATLSKIGLRLYQYYESGEREPRVSTAIRIAEVLQSTVEDLFK